MNKSQITPAFLFPAHAGVIPDTLRLVVILLSFPRTRGGDPSCGQLTRLLVLLFPAHAEVVLLVRVAEKSSIGVFLYDSHHVKNRIFVVTTRKE